MLLLSKRNFRSLDNKFLFITIKNQWVNGLKKSKLTRSSKRRRRIHEWVGNKKDKPCQLWAHQHKQELQVKVYIEHP